MRIEYFGGLLINRKTLEKYEISNYDTLYIACFDGGAESNDVIRTIDSTFGVDYRPQTDEFLRLGVLASTSEQACDIVSSLMAVSLEQKRRVKTNYLRSPIELTIYPTLKCQLNCNFCFLRNRRNEKCTERSAGSWIDLITSFLSEGVQDVSILGGEPTLYSEIIELLRGIGNLDFRCTLTSNGQSWSKEIVNEVLDNENITPIFSLSSLSNFEANDSSGSKYSLNKTISLIRLLRKENKRCRVNTVYQHQSLRELIELIDFCEEVGVEKLSLAVNFGAAAGTSAIKEVYDLRSSLRNYVLERNYRLNFTAEGCMLFSADSELDGSIVRTEYQRKQYGCECGNTILEILPSGDMYPCAAFISCSGPIGNAFTDSWKEVWSQSPELNALRNMNSHDLTCLSCSCYHFCRGGCPAYRQMSVPHGTAEFDARCQTHRIHEEMIA